MLFQILGRYILDISNQMGGLLSERIASDRRIRDHDARNRQELILQRLIPEILLIAGCSLKL